MKISHVALVSGLVAVADAVPLRGLFKHNEGAIEDHESPSEEGSRALQSACYGNGDSPPTAKWHPQYSAGWANGYCRFTVDCDSPGYDTQLACCKGAYTGQVSGYCVSQLPNPPTTSPTDSSGSGVFYPDYNTAWPEAGCISKMPIPSGRPTYDTMLECCKGAYGGQVSGKCLSMLPSPPTSSPTNGDFEADFWYPDYGTAWSIAGCSNKLPLPYKNKGDRPSYDSHLACCKGAYAGQMSGACLAGLPSPPTTSPTDAGGFDYYYPDYDTPWSIATCKNTRPLPFSPGDRPTYETMLECCKGAYGGQTSGACLAGLPSPPTTSPTGSDGMDFYYPDYNTPWSIATCKNTRPLPFSPGDRPTYETMIECCKGAYAGQQSGACLAGLPSPPTTSPTTSAGLDVYYRDPNVAWSVGTCINDRPLPNNSGPTYDTKAACCSQAFGGQASHACQCDVNPCYSCNCGTQAELDAQNCGLTCS